MLYFVVQIYYEKEQQGKKHLIHGCPPDIGIQFCSFFTAYASPCHDVKCKDYHGCNYCREERIVKKEYRCYNAVEQVCRQSCFSSEYHDGCPLSVIFIGLHIAIVVYKQYIDGEQPHGCPGSENFAVAPFSALKPIDCRYGNKSEKYEYGYFVSEQYGILRETRPVLSFKIFQ